MKTLKARLWSAEEKAAAIRSLREAREAAGRPRPGIVKPAGDQALSEVRRLTARVEALERELAELKERLP